MVTIGARTVATTGATGAEADGRTAARSLQETPGVAVRDAQLALAALAALTGPARHGAARALAELTEAYGHDDVAQILHEWLHDRPGAT